MKFNKSNEYNTIKVSDGYDIINIFLNDELRKKIKLILTDENMDFLNGSEAIKFIRQFENSKKETPKFLVSLSANEDTSMNQYLSDCGADRILNKPFSKSNCRELFKELKLIQ